MLNFYLMDKFVVHLMLALVRVVLTNQFSSKMQIIPTPKEAM